MNQALKRDDEKPDDDGDSGDSGANDASRTRVTPQARVETVVASRTPATSRAPAGTGDAPRSKIGQRWDESHKVVPIRQPQARRGRIGPFIALVAIVLVVLGAKAYFYIDDNVVWRMGEQNKAIVAELSNTCKLSEYPAQCADLLTDAVRNCKKQRMPATQLAACLRSGVASGAARKPDVGYVFAPNHPSVQARWVPFMVPQSKMKQCEPVEPLEFEQFFQPKSDKGMDMYIYLPLSVIVPAKATKNGCLPYVTETRSKDEQVRYLPGWKQ